MTSKLWTLWHRVASTLWFIPGSIVVGAGLLALLMVDVSVHVDRPALARFPLMFGASASSSRSMLSAIAGSMITVAGVTFSITIVAVTQASSQYTPRILRNFMRDRANQLVLGAFVGIFAYCLVVLRTIRGVDERAFVPSIAVLGGVVLAIVGIAVLIFFVHHIASTLQASGIIERVTRETVAEVDRLFPREIGSDAAADPFIAPPPVPGGARWRPVRALSTGYVQGVDIDRLVRLAVKHRCTVRMERGVGDFVIEGTPIASVAAARDDTAVASAGDEDTDCEVSNAFALSSYRAVEQDPAFGVRQIVDIALKALSPGVNDTTTASTCVDYLGAILVRIANRHIELTSQGGGGAPHVLMRGPTFDGLLRAALDEVRQNASGNVSVLARVLGTIETVASQTRSFARRAALAQQIALMMEVAERSVPAEHDRQRLRDLANDARAACGTAGGLGTRDHASGDA